MNEPRPPLNADHLAGGEYVVVARRYRPQAFDELIGQEHVAKALKGAIESDRVGHAYLFTGARGVGKTSSARILAKALNCERGTSSYPCGECEICRSIASGDDVDVLEIDGASNRGIDEIRQLRQNVAVRPARARLKIYIIDEVHMLTKEAFNALLKTLEEPPEHVKFIFATTEANKIPITILSRCQRFDFAGIEPSAIHRRLADIAANEGIEVESDALQIIAMRAAGSMRDSQSLLEQLLSTGNRKIAAKDVTDLLGLAPAARLSRLVEPLVERNAAAALAELDAAINEGAEPGQLIDQLLGYFRDAMTQAVGCDVSQLLYALPTQREEIQRVGHRMGVETLLAVSQALDQAAARLRVSTQVRTLAEMTLVRICQLQNLDEIAALIERLKGGEPSAEVKKNKVAESPVVGAASVLPTATSAASASTTVATAPSKGPVTLDAGSAELVWRQALENMTGFVAEFAATATKISADGQGRLVVSFPESQKFNRDTCQRPANLSKIEAALEQACGGRAGLSLVVHPDPVGSPAPPMPANPKRLQAEAAADPFVQRAVELFDGDAERMHVVTPRGESSV